MDNQTHKQLSDLVDMKQASKIIRPDLPLDFLTPEQRKYINRFNEPKSWLFERVKEVLN